MNIVARIALALALMLIFFSDAEAWEKKIDIPQITIGGPTTQNKADDHSKAEQLLCQKYKTPAGLVTQTTIDKTGVVLNHSPITVEMSKKLVDRTMSMVNSAGELKNKKALTDAEIKDFARDAARDLKICTY